MMKLDDAENLDKLTVTLARSPGTHLWHILEQTDPLEGYKPRCKIKFRRHGGRMPDRKYWRIVQVKSISVQEIAKAAGIQRLDHMCSNCFGTRKPYSQRDTQHRPSEE